MIDPSTHIAVSDVLARFFLAFDTRDWDMMAACLSADVFVDYASSGRESPGSMAGSEFVRRRRGAVDTLSKQHSFSNLLLTPDGARVKARCNYLILRFETGFADEGEDFYHSCGAYEFVLGLSAEAWKIESITQRLLRSWGNRQLHGGSRKTPA